MSIQVEFWELVKLLLAFFGFLFAAGKLLLMQIERRLDERFTVLEESREQAGKHWDERFAAIEGQRRRESEGWSALEREFLKFQADLPLQYVRREDYVRGQSVIEAKLDALYSKLELVQIKRNHNG
ncbi:MAG: hypothetical protein LBE62_03000 [Azonexus sp.]|jgi:hypothetical protein|nr:hypothetical protein [Azonexus sp.]